MMRAFGGGVNVDDGEFNLFFYNVSSSLMSICTALSSFRKK